MLTGHKGATGNWIANDAANIGKDGEAKHNVPEDLLRAQALAKLMEEGQEGKLDGPETGPEEHGGGELQLEIGVENFHDVRRRGLQAAGDARVEIHGGGHELVQHGAGNQDEQRQTDKGIVDEEAAEAGQADIEAKGREEDRDGHSSPDDPLCGSKPVSDQAGATSPDRDDLPGVRARSRRAGARGRSWTDARSLPDRS